MNHAPASAAPRSVYRLRLIATLALGTALALGLLVASSWLPVLAWAAVAVALLSGFLAVWGVYAEFRAWRVRALAEAAAERAAQTERTLALHATQRQVLAGVDRRMGALDAELGNTRRELAGVRSELGESQQVVSRLRGDNEALRVENTGLKADNEALRTENTQLRARVVEEEQAELAVLPRRRATDANADWDGTDAPTVVNLDLQRLTSPFVAELRRRHAN